MPTKRKFTPEFKKEAVNLVLKQGLTVSEAASDLSIGKSTLDKWVREFQKRAQDPNALSESELAELKRLRKEVHLLKLERDLLKKTTVYFAKSTESAVNS